MEIEENNHHQETIDSRSIVIEEKTNFLSMAFYTLVFVFSLLPFFFLSFEFTPFNSTKMTLVFLGTFLALALFIVGRLRDGSISIPSQYILAVVWSIPLVYILSAIFSSPAISFSFVGHFFERDTVFFIIINVIILTLIPLLAPSKQRIFNVFLLLFLGFVIVAVFQTLRVFLGADFLSFGIFTDSASNLIGKWNDLGIFFGLMAVLSFVTLEGLTLHIFSKVVLYFALIISFFFSALVNFTPIWVILSLFSLGFLVYSFMKRHRDPNFSRLGLSVTSLFVLVVSILFMVWGQSVGTITSSFFGIEYVEVRPSWQTTINIAGNTYKEGMLLGSGPNTFSFDWNLYKSAEVNLTPFWNTNFNSAIGFIPTSFITTGLLGILAWSSFFILFLYSGIRALIFRPIFDALSYYLVLSTFLASLYLWVFAWLYIPNGVILSLTFFFTGLYLATLRLEEERSQKKTLIFSEKPRLGFVVVLGLTVVLIFTVVGAYFVIQRYVAGVYFQRAVVVLATDGDDIESGRMIRKAIARADIDTYFRFASDLDVRKLNGILTEERGLSVDERREQFQETLRDAISNAQRARDVNPNNFQNWLSIGRIYQSVVAIPIDGAYDNAKNSYERALSLSPHNPEIYLALAELEVLNGNNELALNYIGRALKEKSNYTSAVFLLAQIQVNEGRIDEAIQSVESATLLEPNNPVVFFQLGFLKYNKGDHNGARRALERAIELNDVYANARYYLGLSNYYLGNVEDAIVQFEKIQETNPDNEEVKLILINLKGDRDPFTDFVLPEEREGLPIGGE